MTEKISQKEVIARYEQLDSIWPDSDKWHSYTGRIIGRTVRKWVRHFYLQGMKVLNLGSGGMDYGLDALDFVHADLCVKNLPRGCSVVCTAESLPFDCSQFDMVICVGSVLNYCDPFVVIGELRRVIKPGGKLIVEFEKSESLEFFGTEAFFANAAMVTTFYVGQQERLWVYSEKYIENALHAFGFTVKKRRPFHIISSFLLYKFPSEFAAKFCIFDWFFLWPNLIGKMSTNAILLCEAPLE